MFKPTKRQRTLFETEQRLGDSVRRRLKGTWAEGFQSKVLPMLLDAESEFAALYSDETGRPNWSAARMLGICVLQEMLALDDQSALDSLAFDVRWQHALGLEPEEAYLSRRSLVEFRSRLTSHDTADEVAAPVVRESRSTGDQGSGTVDGGAAAGLDAHHVKHFYAGTCGAFPQDAGSLHGLADPGVSGST